MTEGKRKAGAHAIEKQIELDAPAEKIWRMLTDPHELARWFPLAARVEPGTGGKISLSWGPGYEATAPIGIWEPDRGASRSSQILRRTARSAKRLGIE
jgi:uncharacterized protein YndB with AHSA1/START domain